MIINQNGLLSYDNDDIQLFTTSLPKMHYMKRSMQLNGWVGDYNVFLKYSFYKDFYLLNKLNIPTTDDGILFIKNKIPQYIIQRNPTSIFTTKLMDLKTENNLHPNFSVKQIENDFDKHLNIRYLKENDPTNTKLQIKSDFNHFAINYFILQKTRNPKKIIDLVNSYFPNIKLNDIDPLLSYYFRQIYNQKIPTYFNHFLTLSDCSKPKHLCRLNVSSDNLLAKNLVTFGEFNCVNLSFYLTHIQNEELEVDTFISDNIDIAAISGDTLYLLIHNYNPKNKDIYNNIFNFVGKTWNSFSFITSYQYLVCPSTNDFQDYLAKMLHDAHKNDALTQFYNINTEFEKFLCIEGHLT
jgi:hypothetical protein